MMKTKTTRLLIAAFLIFFSDIDYLLKPFSYDEFLKAAGKASKQAELQAIALHP